MVRCSASIPLLLVGLLASACSSEDRAEVAIAKCGLPVSDAAGFGDKEFPTMTGVKSTALDDGRYRVTGQSTVIRKPSKAVTFVCEVAPDDRDKLRGFKVTKLDVSPVKDGA